METLQRTANRGSLSTGYEIENSLKFEDDNFEWIDSGTSTSTTSNKIGTISFWFKRTELSGADQHIWSGASSARYVGIRFDSNEKLKGYFSALGNGADFVSTQVFRDTSAWYHIVLAIDTTNSTAGDRFKIYVNGERITDWDTTPAIDQNTAIEGFEASARQAWAQYNAIYPDDAVQVSGYLAETYFINGQQLAASSFGEFDSDTGIWIPKEYTGTFGDKGYYLKFDDSSSLGADSSGNGNNFTLNNITAVDQATDTPTNNFNIINPNQGYYLQGNTYYSYTDGNTKQENTLGNIRGAAQTMSVNKGKWYCEWKYTAGTDQQIFVGILAQDEDAYNVEQNAYSAATTCTWYPKQQLTYYKNNGTLVTASATRNSGISAGDVIGMFLDMDNNHLYFQKNGSDINVGEVDASTLLFSESNLFDCNDQYVCFYANTYDTPNEITWNWGGINLTGETTSYSDANGYGAFKYEPVRGSDNYYALCSKNLAEYG